ncbi:MAG: phosphotransferase [Myxococcota bacterium]
MRSPVEPAPQPAVIADPAALTPDWMTAALRQAGLDVRVTGLRSEPVGTGQMAHNERIHLEIDPASPDAARAPATLVGKFPSPSPESRASGARGGYRAETLFYTRLASDLAIRTPACFYGALGDDESTFTLLLEDMAPAVQGDQIAGASDDEIEAAVRNLAGLHAPRWNHPALDGLDWVVAGVSAEFATYVEMATPVFFERYKERVAPEDAETLRAFAAGVRRWVERRPTDRTLVHGDYRLDNLLFERTRDGVRVAAVDWQTLSVACGGQDLAFLLGNSSPPEQRRAHEDHMLAVYRESLAALGVERSAEEVRRDYVYGSFQGPTITMLGSLAVGQTERGDAMFMAMASRSAAQIRDLGALEILR